MTCHSWRTPTTMLESGSRKPVNVWMRAAPWTSGWVQGGGVLSRFIITSSPYVATTLAGRRGSTRLTSDSVAHLRRAGRVICDTSFSCGHRPSPTHGGGRWTQRNEGGRPERNPRQYCGLAHRTVGALKRKPAGEAGSKETRRCQERQWRTGPAC